MMPLSRVRADAREHTRALPGDALIPNAVDSWTHATTLNCRPAAAWPWLVQMGAGRAGWYSYDWIDNGSQPSATRIVPALQEPNVGSIFPALPGSTDAFVLVDKETNHWLVLGVPGERGGYVVTWAFVLEEMAANRTRLLVRARGSAEYRFHGMPHAMSLWLMKLVHSVMERKQLIEIAARAEARPA
jgi:hypothetical protein